MLVKTAKYSLVLLRYYNKLWLVSLRFLFAGKNMAEHTVLLPPGLYVCLKVLLQKGFYTLSFLLSVDMEVHGRTGLLTELEFDWCCLQTQEPLRDSFFMVFLCENFGTSGLPLHTWHSILQHPDSTLMTRGVTLALLLSLTGSGKTEGSDSQGKPTTQRVHKRHHNCNCSFCSFSETHTFTKF